MCVVDHICLTVSNRVRFRRTETHEQGTDSRANSFLDKNEFEASDEICPSESLPSSKQHHVGGAVRTRKWTETCKHKRLNKGL